jgi:hypothetical protein
MNNYRMIRALVTGELSAFLIKEILSIGGYYGREE